MLHKKGKEMKKQFITIALLLGLLSPVHQTKTVCHSAAAVAGGVLGGAVGGILLGVLFYKAAHRKKKDKVATTKNTKTQKKMRRTKKSMAATTQEPTPMPEPVAINAA